MTNPKSYLYLTSGASSQSRKCRGAGRGELAVSLANRAREICKVVELGEVPGGESGLTGTEAGSRAVKVKSIRPVTLSFLEIETDLGKEIPVTQRQADAWQMADAIEGSKQP